MSIPFFARLWWDGHRNHGHATCDGLEMDLTEPPHVLGDPAELDYGEVHPGEMAYAQIRPHDYDQMREMEAPEVVAVRQYLREMSAAMRRFLRRRGKA